MATAAEHDLTFAEVESNKEKDQVFGILRLQEEKSTEKSATAMKAGDGRWQAPIFALARKASETFSGSIHVLPKVAEPKSPPFSDDWGAKGKLCVAFRALYPASPVGLPHRLSFLHGQ